MIKNADNTEFKNIYQVVLLKMESIRQDIANLTRQKKNIYYGGSYLEEFILLPQRENIVSFITLTLFVLFFSWSGGWVEVQDMATETISEEQAD